MEQHIRIEKNLIPYRFDMEFSNGIFTFELNYNSSYDFFTVDLYDGDTPIVLAEKICHGKELFSTVKAYNPRVPDAYIVPLDVTGAAIEGITWDNFGTTVQLFVGEEVSL